VHSIEAFVDPSPAHDSTNAWKHRNYHGHPSDMITVMEKFIVDSAMRDLAHRPVFLGVDVESVLI